MGRPPGGKDTARRSKVPRDQRVEVVLTVLCGTEKLEVLARRHQVVLLRNSIESRDDKT